MTDVEAPYVEEIEIRTTADGEVDNDWAVIHCQYGDTYQAFFEDGGWWLEIPGEPGEGPFATPEDAAARLEEEL